MAFSASCFELKVPIRFILSPGLWLNISHRFAVIADVKLLGEHRGSTPRSRQLQPDTFSSFIPRLELPSNEAGKGAKLGGRFCGRGMALRQLLPAAVWQMSQRHSAPRPITRHRNIEADLEISGPAEELDQVNQRMFAMTSLLPTRVKEDTSFAPVPRGWRPGQRRMEQPQISVLPYTLAGISIFAGLTPKALEGLQQSCAWRRYEQGEPIVGYLD